MANNDLVGSVVKAMALVKLVASSPDGLKLNELAEMASLKTVTCFNLVRTLIAGGFLERISGRLYIGQEISRLSGNRFNSVFFRLAEEVLLSLNEQWPRATAIFAVPGKYGMEQTHRISFDRPGVMQHLNNESLPPYASAAGLVGLSFIEDENVLLNIAERYPFAEHGINLWGDKKKLNAFLAQCRKDRFAICPFEEEIFRRVSVPVFDSRERFVAVLGMSCPAKEFSEKEFESVIGSLRKKAELFRKS